MWSIIFKGEFLVENPEEFISTILNSDKCEFNGEVYKYELNLINDNKENN